MKSQLDKNVDSISNKWLTYNAVINELNFLNKSYISNEIKYKITDGEIPSIVILTSLSKLKHDSPELLRLYNKVANIKTDKIVMKRKRFR